MKFKNLFLFVLLAAGWVSQNMKAQSLIAGIPSADVVHKGNLEFTHESQINFWSDPNQFKWASFNFICYGIGHETEITASLVNLANKDMNNLAFGTGFKKAHQFFKKDSTLSKWETKLTFGQNVFFSLQRPEVSGWVYSHASFRLPKLHTRLTGGLTYGSPTFFDVAWTTENGSLVRNNDAVLCALAGIEQPFGKHFSLIADWYSGKHGIAAAIVATQFNFGHNVLILGYKKYNTETWNNGAIILEAMLRL
jgi:hypothetical protein